MPSEPAPVPSPLPATLRLPPHRAVLSLSAGGRLLGLDPATAPAVDGLAPPLAEMLDELDAPADPHRLVARAAGRGADPAEAEALLRMLVDAGALVDAAAAERTALRRAGSTVVVSGRGPLAVGIVAGLARAGVGTVHTDTGGSVRAGDLGTGYVDADRGRDRLTATRTALRTLLPGARTGPPPLRLVPDLVVLADEVPPPERVTALLADGVAHLPARLREGVGVVGPLVLPGRSACLGCLELHRAAHDPGWPAVAAQLVGRPGLADPACVVATVALATAQALVAVDGCVAGEPPALDATLELDVTAGSLVRRVWAPYPGCCCGASTARSGLRLRCATSAWMPGGDTIKV